ncbi:MAG: cytochrome c biogenesis heme-transporting ATPase CcmA [Gammaproteobacteria bacterium]
MPEQQSEVLTAEQLQLWRGDRCLFEHLDVRASPGGMVHVRGPNGAGKTSLMRVLCGLLPADEGQVRWRGRPIDRVRGTYHSELAYLGHRDGLKHDLTAVENLRFGCGLKRRTNERTLRAALERAGVEAAADLPVRFLSAGQRRRVAMARVTAIGALLWLLDEPFTNLDADGTAFVARAARAHLQAGGLLVMASHRLPPEMPAEGVTSVVLG